MARRPRLARGSAPDGQNTTKISARAVNACSPPRARQRRGLLAPGARHDSRPASSGSSLFDQLPVRPCRRRTTAWINARSTCRPVRTSQQPFARLAVQAIDTSRNFLVASTVVALGCKELYSVSISRSSSSARKLTAPALALAAQPLQSRLDVGEIGQAYRLDAGPVPPPPPFDLQHVVNFAADVGETALGALEAFLGARQILARGAGCFER